MSDLQPSYPLSGISSENQLEIIWQMGLASLTSNNYELILPKLMGVYLPHANIEELKLRLSQHLLGAPTIAFVDEESQVFRICRVPRLVNGGDSSSSASSPSASSASPKSSTPATTPIPPYKPAAHGKKSKVPRPPNAFILYRKDRHPVLKKESPELHNNQISCILGDEWNNAPDSVKFEYKAKAEKIKKQHVLDNPGYQYAPRKPAEKKRRMTAKKLARMRNAAALSQTAERVHSTTGGDDFSDLESEDDMPSASPPTGLLTAEAVLGTRRTPSLSHLSLNEDLNLEVTLPSNNKSLRRETLWHNFQLDPATAQPFLSARRTQVSTFTPTYVQDDNAFFESLIDWEGIARDTTLVTGATPQEAAELAPVEMGNPYLHLSAEDQREAFKAELERTMKFFE